ncbi:uncharacterized protein [Cicer arietinum]|uniref:Uncharacterized protein LOC101500004 n=1 Tax=Cicer arietinum TaxID=3827 RepID=A0A1S2Y915_CICAR|nr:uncharacterized protein LOC101500004 [Cicer arietinum]
MMSGLNNVSDDSPRQSLTMQFSSLMIIDPGRLSYDKLPSQTLTLSILKLDSSSFHVEVPKTATVAVLKQAVESAFSHVPLKGPEKISWPLVWGRFCLCYEGQKLVTETDYLRDYGIKDGDQLRFVRHVSNICSFQRQPLKKRNINLKQHGRSSSQVNGCQQKEHDDDDDDNIGLDHIVIENGKIQHSNAEENCLGMSSRLTGYLGGLFSETRMAVVRKARMEGGVCRSMISKGIVSSLRKVKGIVGHCRRPHRRHTWREFSSL